MIRRCNCCSLVFVLISLSLLVFGANGDRSVHRKLEGSDAPTYRPTVAPSFQPSLRPSLKPTRPPISPPTFVPTNAVTKQVEDILQFSFNVTIHGSFWHTLDEASLAALNSAAANTIGISKLALRSVQTYSAFESNNDQTDDATTPVVASFTPQYAAKVLKQSRVDPQFTSYICIVEQFVYVNMVDFPSSTTEALYEQMKGSLLNATFIYDANPDVFNVFSANLRSAAVAEGSTMLTIAKVVSSAVSPSSIEIGSANLVPTAKPTSTPKSSSSGKKKDITGTGKLGVLGVLGIVAAFVYMLMCCGCFIMFRREKQRQREEEAEANKTATRAAAAATGATAAGSNTQSGSQRNSVVSETETTADEEAMSHHQSLPEDRYRSATYGDNNYNAGYPQDSFYTKPPNDGMFSLTNNSNYDNGNGNGSGYNGGSNRQYGNVYNGNNFQNNQAHNGSAYVGSVEMFSVHGNQSNPYSMPPQHGAGFTSYYDGPH